MFEVRDEETIIAQCTPSGSGAIALLRVSGENALEIAQKFAVLPHKKFFRDLPSHTIHYGQIIDESNHTIDHVLFLLMRAPQTFTGQNTIEITCHNNPFIIAAIINQAIKHGARIAQRGEFTKRAFLNKKIDITQAEAINELIHAHTEQALKKSLTQLEGSFSHWINKIEEKLLHALSLCEASFEFVEEDVNFDQQIKLSIHAVIQDIVHIEKEYDHQQQIKEGIRIALIGSVNAGKSALFNKLIKTERAIVTEIAGTTRDVIEAGIYRNQSYITFVDTAGLRETEEKIEQEGIKRSFKEAEKADIILLIIDSSQKLSQLEENLYNSLIKQYQPKVIPIASKIDLSQQNNFIPDALKVSALTNQGIDTLEQKIKEKMNALLNNYTAPYLLNQRQFKLLEQLKKPLKHIAKMTHETIEHELLSIHLRDALELLTELSGKSLSDRSIDDIFKNFCVGK
ncbi:TPA: tRNA uridine-5-carboxymethylaminomethyl(34) synthesis GTPase MnmE [Candidatus Dependentiae bacterium]|nr:MAG: tRNA modification GTPase MnmE [candidate division TM6 bacterium GW2011_GWF2_36_131]KKQ03586.1 MAG: tRNA modification GTPase MnmE [candidate division TM6 bacterium GW2011_GWE2_36_25]HBR70680.1 tRNA uridine-5-carboxymethylaminomethyl(34) synthesis GTPase MnmE [Candidatus Dependentiae bacterium]HCU00300.1 tRNA uridine-5-carboxymethylaminomethyl(34) synthesis GTPase MnmE [Candidatus Dependentiae bacterium]